ncbi:MAG: sulfatase-like hydrolase/transferase [Verrucomicrobia bacterium]|nr:sulfatase-like hydrolase/transferase [Verrucomicrobiota bacterium]
MNNLRALFVGVFLSVLLLGAACTKDTRPNILLVMADDQGYGDAGFTGHPFVKTPNMDAMAKDSLVFNRFYAGAPVCSPTRASVMTGRTPMRTNVPNHGHYMRPKEKTIAEALKDAGYVTGHFGKWHIGSVQKESPTSPGGAGFDEWFSGLNFFDLDPYLSRNGTYENPKGQGSIISMDATIDFLKKHKDGDKPMFTVTWFPAPHDPHLETPVDFPGGQDLYKDEKDRGYFLEITLLDQQLGKLRQSLRDMGITDNTLVWYCSDNGGLVEESSGGRAKKGSIYEGGLRVPSILEWPAKFKPGTIDTPACTFDIYPTLLTIAGAEVDHQPRLDGIDLAEVIAGKQTKRPAMGFWHLHTGGQSTWSDRIIKQLMEAQQAGKPTPLPDRLLKNVQEFPSFTHGDNPGHAAWNDWPWKLHRIQQGDQVTVELYNLVDDPMEENDLAQKEKGRASTMLKELEQWQSSVYDSWEGKDY